MNASPDDRRFQDAHYVPIHVRYDWPSATATAVYCVLRFAQHDDTHALITQAMVADVLNISTKAVQRATIELEDAGLITLRRGRKGVPSVVVVKTDAVYASDDDGDLMASVPFWLLRRIELGRSPALQLFLWLRCYNAANRKVPAPLSALAERTGVQLRVIERAMHELLEIGAVRRTRNGREVRYEAPREAITGRRIRTDRRNPGPPLLSEQTRRLCPPETKRSSSTTRANASRPDACVHLTNSCNEEGRKDRTTRSETGARAPGQGFARNEPGPGRVVRRRRKS